jgi:VanZ family protein
LTAAVATFTSLCLLALLLPLQQDETLQVLFNVGHIPAFALLTVLWLELAGQYGVHLLNRVLIVGGIAVVLALATEALQALVPGRYPDLGDVIRNLLGIALGLLAHRRWPQAIRSFLD